MSAPREVTAKIVFYGPGLSGKTTNLKKVFAMLKEEARGKLMALSTQSDRTIFFDYLPINLGSVRGMRLKIQLYTVPGQVFYNSTRRLVLKNVDGVVFVADSGRRALPDNLESLTNLQENLTLYGKSLNTVPWVLQYNKRDLPDALPLATLRDKLNRWEVPEFEASANRGKGVMETLSGITKLVVKNLRVAPTDSRPEPEQPETRGSGQVPVDVQTPLLDVPEEPAILLPRVPGALTDDELNSTIFEDGADRTVEPPTPPVAATEVTARHGAPKPVSAITPPARKISAVSESGTASVGLLPHLAEELPEIEIEDDFETLDDVEEIEPMAEVEIKTLGKARWRDGTLIVPLEIKVGNSEFNHEIAIRLEPMIEEPTTRDR